MESDSKKEEAEPGQISPQTSSGCYPHVCGIIVDATDFDFHGYERRMEEEKL